MIPQRYIEPVEQLEQKDYRIAYDIPAVGGRWTKAEAVADLPNNQQLLQLPDCDMGRIRGRGKGFRACS